jgi:hypothetical protein
MREPRVVKVQVEAGTSLHKESFAYADLAKGYQSFRWGEPDRLQDAARWQVAVRVNPVLDATEREAVGLIERNLIEAGPLLLETEAYGVSVLVSDATAECPIDRRPLDGQ